MKRMLFSPHKAFALRGLKSNQSGATLIIGLIFLTFIALAVSTAFTLSSTNLQAVGNMQNRDEAVAAANQSIEQVVSSLMKTSGGTTFTPTADQNLVDIDSDGTNDFTVDVALPVCLEVAEVSAGSGPGSGSSAGLGLPSVEAAYNTLWNITATATDTKSGTSVVVNQGVRIQISETLKTAHCS